MSRSSASTGSARSGDETADAPTGATLVLSVSATVATFGLLSPLAHWAINPVHLAPPLASQNQKAENLVFLATFAVFLPLAALFVPRTLDRVSHRQGGEVAAESAIALGIALCALIVGIKVGERVLSASRPAMLFVAAALWWVLAAVALRGLGRGGNPPAALARVAPALWPALAASLGAVILCLADLGSIALLPLAAGLALSAGVGWMAYSGSPRLSGPPGRLTVSPRALRRGADLAAIVLLALAVPNLSVFWPGGPAAGFETSIIQFHQNFYLGPANALVGGGTMLVDVVSQYGVGSIVFLAGVFKLIPIGYGTLALTEGVLAAGMFCLAYATLRLAGVGPLLAWAAMAVAVVVLVFNLLYPLGGLLQHGAFRFGMPMVILAAAAGETRARRGRPLLAAIQVLTVGVASLWSFEALLYSLGAIAGIAAFRVGTMSAGRLRAVARLALQVLAACLAVQLVFALATLAGAGQLPDWGNYLSTLREFLTGKIGELTYDFTSWSAGLGLGAVYLGSTLALVLVVRREPGLAAECRPMLLVLSGTTGYGIALFSYLVNRSADHIIPYVSLPAVMIVALWLAVVLRDGRLSRPGRGLAAGSVSAAAVLLVAVAWSGVGLRLSQSALAYAVPGGRSLGSAIDRLWDEPVLAPGAADATRLLDTYMPGEHESVVLTSPDLSVEALMRTHRINEIPLSDPWEDSFVPDLHRDAVETAVAKLQPGRRMLIDGAARQVLATPARQGAAATAASGIATLQALALREIAARFRLEPVARTPSGVEVVELRPR
jgi:hypothetical protein